MKISVLTFFLLLFSFVAQANIITVNSTQDLVSNDGNCTLREAVTAANFDIVVDQCNKGLGNDLIFLLIGASNESIQLGSQLPIIDGLEIIGPGADKLVLFPANGNSNHIFQINTNGDVTLQNFRIGGAQSSAIDVVNVADLTLSDMQFLNNHAASTEDGGALYLSNTNPSLNYSRTILLENILFQGNQAVNGAAISINGEYVLEVHESEFINNTATSFGAAIHKNSGELQLVGRSPDTIHQSQFIGNTGSSIVTYNLQQLDINQSVFYQNNSDSIVYNFNSFGSISNSLFAENAGSRVIYNNSSTQAGVPQSELSINFNTFVDNGGIAILTVWASTAFITGNVFAGQLGCSDGTNEGQPVGFVVSNGYNLEDNDRCASHATDVTFTDALLLPTGDYSGQLLAPPSPISPLVDAASTCSSQDLSGEGRPRDGDGSGGLGQCDIGAVERPNAYGLALSFPGNGGGEVSLPEFDLVCQSPDACLWPLPRNETFSFQPSADTGSTFIAWGDSCSGDTTCDVNMNGFRFLSADFSLVQNPVTLTVGKFGSAPNIGATVTSSPAGINCGPTCVAQFIEGDVLELTAVPDANTSIGAWTGCDSISADGLICTATLNSNTTINVFYDLNTDLIFENSFE